jgi:sugar (pentulose or hexulose) kinase
MTAVIDIGMTNKKVAIYDPGLQLQDSASRTFEALPVDDIETHDLAGMEDWFIDTLAGFARRYDIGAIAVSTHGATQVCVGADGQPSAPCAFYTHEPGDEFQQRFYALAGTPEDLQAVTGTPRFPALLNMAKAILFIKERFPGALDRTVQVLNFPQYWGYRLTGQYGAEGTFVANHGYLWDWQNDSYSAITKTLGLSGKMPVPLRKSWDILGRITPAVAAATGLKHDVIVTMGIHDSNASLLPHLAKRPGQDFILNSTGTWCVIMHPQKRYGFAPGELGKVVFFNRSAYLDPVKTAIFLGGKEYEQWSALISRLAGIKAQDPGPAAYPALFAAQDAFILPELVPGSGQFPGSRARAAAGDQTYTFADMEAGRAVPAFMRDPVKAMAALNASLVIQTVVALKRAGLVPGTEIFTEGGFRKNSDYNSLLATALPGNRVRLTDIAEATAMGAAMTAVAALEGSTPDALKDRFDITYKAVLPMTGLGAFTGSTQPTGPAEPTEPTGPAGTKEKSGSTVGAASGTGSQSYFDAYSAAWHALIGVDQP